VTLVREGLVSADDASDAASNPHDLMLALKEAQLV
jgi:hypothetical protein